MEPATPPGGVLEGAPGLRILLAEDSQDNVLLIQSYLKASGCSVDLAGNGEVALQKFISGTYDVVLMDVQMPVMDGYSATRRVRQWEGENRAKPVPILAGRHALPERSARALSWLHIPPPKPIRKATLMHASKSTPGPPHPVDSISLADSLLLVTGGRRGVRSARNADYETPHSGHT